MKKFLLATLIASASVTALQAEVSVTAVPAGDITHSPMKVMHSTEPLVTEDFSGFTEGTLEEPNYEDCLADRFNMDIDPSLTHGDQWTGNMVYQAGGAAALHTLNVMNQAMLCSPKGDYSGSVVVTFRAKYLKTEWEMDGTWYHTDGTTLSMGLMTNDAKRFDVPGEDANSLIYMFKLYEDYDWFEFTVEFDNYSAYNDAFICFYSPDSVLIDDIKISSSVDKFIAAPVVTGVSDVTETSFTVNFEPVRKTNNYYLYLYTLIGYEEETGQPIYFPERYRGQFTEEEWIQEITENPENKYYPYSNVGIVDKNQPTQYTFTNLDPSVEYYYAVRSHYIMTFSDCDIKPMRELAVPEIGKAKDISSDSFTATWSPISKADSYQVSLYGVNQVEADEEDYIIFDEDFEYVSNYTDVEDIDFAEYLDYGTDVTIDDLTVYPGWRADVNHLLFVKGMLGIDSWNMWVATPELYVGGSDEIKVAIKAYFIDYDNLVNIQFAGQTYHLEMGDTEFEGEFILPTNGLETAKLEITGPSMYPIFIDYISISQSLKAGDCTYIWLDTTTTQESEITYTSLNTEDFSCYGYAVKAVKGEGYSAIYSEQSKRQVVDLTKGSSFEANVISFAEKDIVETERYSLDGRKIDQPEKGINIVRFSDGSVKKVIVK